MQRAIVAQNVTTPGGAVDTGPQQLTFRVSGRVPTVTAVGEIVVRAVEGHPIRVADVGTSSTVEEEAETAASIDGEPAVVLSIRKQSGTNTVAVVDALNERMKEFDADACRRATSSTVIRDNSETIRTSVGAVKEHLVLGAVLAALVVLLFLGSLRSTIIAAIAIPISIIGTFVCMWWMGFTLNTITLLALALAVGIVIDDAIVVLENIFRFIDEKKVRPMPAAIHATKEIGLPVLATTLSLMAVFLPVAFMSAIPGRFLRSFGLTMAFAIADLAARQLHADADAVVAPAAPAGGQGSGASRSWSESSTCSTGRSSASTWRCCGSRSGTAGSSCWRRSGRWSRWGRWSSASPRPSCPKNDEAQFEIDVRTPEGTSLAATQIAAERIAREVRQWPEVPDDA